MLSYQYVLFGADSQFLLARFKKEKEIILKDMPYRKHVGFMFHIE